MTERAPLSEFQAWPKIPRLNKQISVTEKIDGTNAAVIVRPVAFPAEVLDHEMLVVAAAPDTADLFAVGAQSRNRLITPQNDNAGFARWVREHAVALATGLGAGRWFGEWWGQGIQRGYDLDEKRFSLFNPFGPRIPGLVDTVPLLLQWGQFDSAQIDECVRLLAEQGSWAAPGYMNPEGVVVRHSASGQTYKRLLENDDIPKGLVTANG